MRKQWYNTPNKKNYNWNRYIFNFCFCSDQNDVQSNKNAFGLYFRRNFYCDITYFIDQHQIISLKCASKLLSELFSYQRIRARETISSPLIVFWAHWMLPFIKNPKHERKIHGIRLCKTTFILWHKIEKHWSHAKSLALFTKVLNP